MAPRNTAPTGPSTTSPLDREFNKLFGGLPKTAVAPTGPTTTTTVPPTAIRSGARSETARPITSLEVLFPTDRPERMARAKAAPALEKEMEKIFGPSVVKALGPRLFEPAQLLAEERERAIISGVPSDKLERLLTGRGELIPGPGGAMVEKGGGVEDIFYGVIQSGPAQKFFAVPLVQKGLKGVDLYSQYTQRSIVSGFKELVDLIPQFPGRGILFGEKDDASWQEFINQAKDPTYGWGKAFPLNSKEIINLSGVPGLGAANKWIDRAAGFAGDILTSPETWLTGVGGIAREAITSIGMKGLTGSLGETAVRSAASRATGEVTEAGIEAVIKGAGKGELANVTKLDALSFAKREALLNREAAILAQKQAEKAAEEAAARVAAGAAPDVAANARKVAATNAAEVNRLDARINTLNNQIAALTPPKTFGRASNMSNAKDIILLKNAAQDTLDTGLYAGLSATPEQLALAQRTVDALTPELIQQVSTKGISVLNKGAFKEAKQLLGVRFGIKAQVPFTTKAVVIPGSEYLTRTIGAGLRGVTGLVRTAGGRQIMKAVTPMGVEGILNSDDILKIRTAFSTGKVTDEFGKVRNLTPEEAIDYLNVISVHDGYLTGYNYLVKFRGEQTRQLLKTIDKNTWAKIGPMLTTPETRWGAAGLSRKNLNAAELKAFQDVQTFLKELDIADETLARSVGAEVYPRFAAALSPTQTTDFLVWAKQNPKGLIKIADQLGINPNEILYSNFVPRLKPNMDWFGHKLTADDIAGGAARLNELARRKVKFDVFSTDVRESLIRVVDRHARYQAYVKTMQDFVEESGDMAYARAMEAIETPIKPGEIGARIELLQQKIKSFITPETVTQWDPAQLQLALARLEDIGQRASVSVVDTQAINNAIQELDDQINVIAAAVDQGILPKPSALMSATEATLKADEFANAINKVKQIYWETDANKWRVMVPEMLRDGFKVIDDAMPTLTAVERNEVQQMLNNMLKASTDRNLWAGFQEAYNKLNTFIKTYLTSTLGFHNRNAQSIIGQSMIAGALPRNATQATGILTKWALAKRKGKTLEQFIDDYATSVYRAAGPTDFTSMIAKDEFKEYLRFAFGSTGTGEVGSLRQGFVLGEKPGVLGLPARGIGPRGSALQRGTQRASEVAANIPIVALGQLLPPALSRRFGTSIENVGKFILVWDGLMQGLSPQRALARSNRFLINYADLSALDKVGRGVFPFYTFMSRNMMTQLTSVWTNPRFYAWYNNYRKNFEETEQETEFFPRDWRKRGVFKMVGDNPFYIKFDLGIPQTTPTPLSQPFSTTFASSNPIVRSVIEAYVFGDSAFTGAPIVRKELGREEIQKAAYVMRNVISPASTSARQIRLLTSLLGAESPVASAFASDWATILFGTKEISEEDKQLLNQFIAVAAYTGVPLTAINDDIKLRELWKAYFEVKDARETAEAIARRQQEELEKERLGLP